DLRLAHVEALHRVTGLEQVLRHRQTHVGETDEADVCHATFPILTTSKREIGRATSSLLKFSASFRPSEASAGINTSCLNEYGDTGIMDPGIAPLARPGMTANSVSAPCERV